MIECIFTIDYEIYGNGQGSLRELVYEPAERLKELFLKWDARFVNFIEVAELEMIEANRTDAAIDLVKNQILDFYRNGFEIGLHLHPQWYNARYENGRWLLDYSEYSLCALPKERMERIINRSIEYLRKTLDEPGFIPFSFRNSNWLFQPSQPLARILADHGIKLDSSVFKGGFQHKIQLDYRRALKNGYYWKFNRDVNVPDPRGTLLEIPTHIEMVFLWKMCNKKRVKLQQVASSSYSFKSKLDRLKDFVRIRQPLKLDFCRLTLTELTGMLDQVIKEDKKDPESFKPIVAIGHSKDLIDFDTVESFLGYLRNKYIHISTFEEVYKKCAWS
ncbi:MAG: hypothetical protein ACFFDN_12795 [Candidatus Hodarchaeota archaeon]